MNLSNNKKMSDNQLNWVIDLSAFGMFFLLGAPRATGIPLHEWLSFAFFGTFIVHILLHWNWIIAISQRLLKKLPGETRFNYFWNLTAYLVMTLTMLSGVLISESALPALGFTLPIDPFWRRLHDLSANLSLLMLAIHLALHWDWVMNSFRRYILRQS